jgi:glutaredoxin
VQSAGRDVHDLSKASAPLAQDLFTGMRVMRVGSDGAEMGSAVCSFGHAEALAAEQGEAGVAREPRAQQRNADTGSVADVPLAITAAAMQMPTLVEQAQGTSATVSVCGGSVAPPVQHGGTADISRAGEAELDAFGGTSAQRLAEMCAAAPVAANVEASTAVKGSSVHVAAPAAHGSPGSGAGGEADADVWGAFQAPSAPLPARIFSDACAADVAAAATQPPRCCPAPQESDTDAPASLDAAASRAVACGKAGGAAMLCALIGASAPLPADMCSVAMAPTLQPANAMKKASLGIPATEAPAGSSGTTNKIAAEADARGCLTGAQAPLLANIFCAPASVPPIGGAAKQDDAMDTSATTVHLAGDYTASGQPGESDDWVDCHVSSEMSLADAASVAPTKAVAACREDGDGAQPRKSRAPIGALPVDLFASAWSTLDALADTGPLSSEAAASAGMRRVVQRADTGAAAAATAALEPAAQAGPADSKWGHLAGARDAGKGSVPAAAVDPAVQAGSLVSEWDDMAGVGEAAEGGVPASEVAPAVQAVQTDSEWGHLACARDAGKGSVPAAAVDPAVQAGSLVSEWDDMAGVGEAAEGGVPASEVAPAVQAVQTDSEWGHLACAREVTKDGVPAPADEPAGQAGPADRATGASTEWRLHDSSLPASTPGSEWGDLVGACEVAEGSVLGLTGTHWDAALSNLPVAMDTVDLSRSRAAPPDPGDCRLVQPMGTGELSDVCVPPSIAEPADQAEPADSEWVDLGAPKQHCSDEPQGAVPDCSGSRELLALADTGADGSTEPDASMTMLESGAQASESVTFARPHADAVAALAAAWQSSASRCECASRSECAQQCGQQCDFKGEPVACERDDGAALGALDMEVSMLSTLSLPESSDVLHDAFGNPARRDQASWDSMHDDVEDDDVPGARLDRTSSEAPEVNVSVMSSLSVPELAAQVQLSGHAEAQVMPQQHLTGGLPTQWASNPAFVKDAFAVWSSAAASPDGSARRSFGDHHLHRGEASPRGPSATGGSGAVLESRQRSGGSGAWGHVAKQPTEAERAEVAEDPEHGWGLCSVTLATEPGDAATVRVHLTLMDAHDKIDDAFEHAARRLSVLYSPTTAEQGLDSVARTSAWNCATCRHVLARTCRDVLQLAEAIAIAGAAAGSTPAATAAACPPAFWPAVAVVQLISNALVQHASCSHALATECSAAVVSPTRVTAGNDGASDATTSSLAPSPRPAAPLSTYSTSATSSPCIAAAQPPVVTLFTTSIGSSRSVSTATRRLDAILDAFSIPYEFVDLSYEPHRRSQMLVHSDGIAQLPQLHVDGVFLGEADELLELHDFGELLPLLSAPAAPKNGVLSATASATGDEGGRLPHTVRCRYEELSRRRSSAEAHLSTQELADLLGSAGSGAAGVRSSEVAAEAGVETPTQEGLDSEHGKEALRDLEELLRAGAPYMRQVLDCSGAVERARLACAAVDSTAGGVGGRVCALSGLPGEGWCCEEFPGEGDGGEGARGIRIVAVTNVLNVLGAGLARL